MMMGNSDPTRKTLRILNLVEEAILASPSVAWTAKVTMADIEALAAIYLAATVVMMMTLLTEVIDCPLIRAERAQESTQETVTEVESTARIYQIIQTMDT